MQIFDDEKNRIGILEGAKDKKIVTTLSTGDKELSFKYPANGPMAQLLKEECYIRTKEDEYVLKARKTGDEYNEYTAQLNVEELESQVFAFGFESKEQTIRACLEFAFDGTDWTVGECSITKKRTINSDEETTAWDVLQDALSTYRCECKINSIKKRIDIYEAVGEDKGRYFIESLNLRKLTVSSDTYDFYTRIIPVGKDNITIEWQGQPYIENHQYSKKNKTYVWKDERYTNTTSLIEDATEKLEEMSKPYVSYEADIIDLAKQNKQYENILDFNIGDAVWIVSKRTNTKEKQRIVKLTEYLDEPWKNTAELSNISKTFAQVQQEATDKAKTEAVSIANNSTKKTLEDNYYTKEETESHITASADEINLGVSKTYETKETVEEKIKQSNELTDEKLKSYSTTEEMKSAISMKADEINSSVSKTVEEKTEESKKYADSAAETAEKNANGYTDDSGEGIREDTNDVISELKQEFSSEIEQTAESVKSTVYESIYKKDEVDEKLSTMSTEIEQTKDSWQVTFNKMQQDMSDAEDDNNGKFEEIKKYIRFEDGNIIIGNSESPLVLRIQNDRLQFLQDGFEVAYITDKKMYNTTCQIVNELSFGDSAWKVEYNEDGDEVVSLVGI